MPLSRNGLCEAETTAARSRPRRLTRIAAAGVGRTPPSSASPPPAAIPAASADSSIGPDSRVSRMIRTCGRSSSSAATAARPSEVASSGVRKVPACPRTPSVPKSLRSAKARGSALAELGPLASLLQAGLAALLDASVPGEEAPPLQVAAEARVDLGEGAGDAIAHRAGLAADAAAMHADADVDGALVAGDGERLAGHRLVQGAGEVLLERPAVDLDGPVARGEDHAGDRGLALAGGEVAGAGLHRGGRAGRGGRLLVAVGGELGLTAPALLLLGLEAGALLGAEAGIGLLESDRIEVGAGREVAATLALLVLGGGLLGGRIRLG